MTYLEAMRAAERRILLAALKASRGSIRAAARALGMHEATLRYRMRAIDKLGAAKSDSHPA